MNTKKIVTALLISTALFSSCKKDDPAPAPAPSFTVSPDGNIQVNSDAAGALYAVYTKTYDDNNGSTFFPNYLATAWFGNAMADLDAGTVKCGGTALIRNFWYMEFTDAPTMFDETASSVEWDVQGNASTAVAGFTHSDNAAFPSNPSYTVGTGINLNTNYTITHTSPGNVDGVVYSVLGNNGQVNKTVMGASTSVTFTSAELKEAALANDQIAFSVMPVKITPVTKNGKKYYFVKQYQALRETTSL